MNTNYTTKTLESLESAKGLAEFLFNDEEAIVRLDMSEYMEQHAVSKMIGSPPLDMWAMTKVVN